MENLLLKIEPFFLQQFFGFGAGGIFPFPPCYAPDTGEKPELKIEGILKNEGSFSNSNEILGKSDENWKSQGNFNKIEKLWVIFREVMQFWNP